MNIKNAFNKYAKGIKVFVPYEAGVIFAQCLLGTNEVPGYVDKKSLNEKLEYIHKEKLSPWYIQVR